MVQALILIGIIWLLIDSANARSKAKKSARKLDIVQGRAEAIFDAVRGDQGYGGQRTKSLYQLQGEAEIEIDTQAALADIRVAEQDELLRVARRHDRAVAKQRAKAFARAIGDLDAAEARTAYCPDGDCREVGGDDFPYAPPGTTITYADKFEPGQPPVDGARPDGEAAHMMPGSSHTES